MALAEGGIKLEWTPRNITLDEFRIYKDTQPFDADNLPTVFQTLQNDTTTFIDYDVEIDITYYYRIGAFYNGIESIGDLMVVIGGQDFSSDLITHYKFDGNTIDSSGNDYDVTWEGTESYDSALFGDGMVASDSTQSYVLLPQTLVDVLNSEIVDGISMSFWINHNFPSTNHRFFGLDLTDYNLQMGIDSSDTLYVRVNGSAIYYNDFEYFNEWVHYVVHMGINQDIVIYENGAVKSEGSGSGPTASANLNAIGNGYANFEADGIIDNFRIFNKILNEQEITLLYNEPRS